MNKKLKVFLLNKKLYGKRNMKILLKFKKKEA